MDGGSGELSDGSLDCRGAVMQQASRPHILVVDDDPDVRALLARYLGAQGLRVSSAADGDALLELIEREVIDLVVLDLGLPGRDGIQLATMLRTHSKVPIVVLTGRSEEADRVMGLELGADDYVTKPFSPRELLARIRAVLRRSQPAVEAKAEAKEQRAFRFGSWELNLRTRKLIAPDNRRIHLSNGEFSLLAAFCGAPQRILSRETLLNLSRLHTDEVYERTIDVQILRLRRKLEVDPRRPQLILTERGAGYLFANRVETVY